MIRKAVSFEESFFDKIEEQAKKERISKSDLISKSLAIYFFLYNEKEKNREIFTTNIIGVDKTVIKIF